MTIADAETALSALARALQTLTETTTQSTTMANQDTTPIVAAINAATAVTWSQVGTALAPLVAANTALVSATTAAVAQSVQAAPAKGLSTAAPA